MRRCLSGSIQFSSKPATAGGCCETLSSACSPSSSVSCSTERLVARDVSALRYSRCFFFPGLWGKKKLVDASNGYENSTDSTSWSGSPSNQKKSFPFSKSFSMPNIDAAKISAVQEMLAKQPPERQKELMEQAMKFQQSFSKIPGFKTFAERQAKLIGNVMAKQPQSSPSSSSFSTKGQNGEKGSASSKDYSRRGSNDGAPSSTRDLISSRKNGPTLDELKKMHLGDEIEELFAELRLIREKKNEYRTKLHIATVQLQEVQDGKQKIEQTERQVREKLKKSEQEVLILNSETMNLEDKVKKAAAQLKKQEQWKREYDTLKSKSEEEQVKGSTWFKDLERQLQQKKDAVQSQQRKLHRLRRHDPLLQLSIACSEWQRLSGKEISAALPASFSSSTLSSSLGNVAQVSSLPSSFSSSKIPSPSLLHLAKAKQEEAFEQLRDNFHKQQRVAWLHACREQNAAARYLIQAAHCVLLSLLPFGQYDACVTLSASTEKIDLEEERDQQKKGISCLRSRQHGTRRMRVEEAQKLFESYGFVVEVLKGASSTHRSSFSVIRSDENDPLVNKEGTNAISGTTQQYQLLIRKAVNEEVVHPLSSVRNSGSPYAVALAAYFCSPSCQTAVSLKENEQKSRTEEDGKKVHDGDARALPHDNSFSTPVLVLDKVVPYLSSYMLRDSNRTVIQYESARSSGPGGQAVNVAETQIHAKVVVDGEVAFTASAQDSRSALQNRKNVEEQVFESKRNYFNENTLGALRPEVVQTQLLAKMAANWGIRDGSVGIAGSPKDDFRSRVDESSSLTSEEAREDVLALAKEACRLPSSNSHPDSHQRGPGTPDSISPLDYAVARWVHQLTADNLLSTAPNKTK